MRNISVRKVVRRNADGTWHSPKQQFTVNKVRIDAIHDVSDIYTLCDALGHLTSGEADQSSLLIQGKLIQNDTLTICEGDFVDRIGKGPKATFQDGPTNVFCLDWDGAALTFPADEYQDGYSLDASAPLQTLGIQIRDRILPPEFQGVTCGIQATGSFGTLKDGVEQAVRLRFWFYLEQPLYLADLKAYVEHRLKSCMNDYAKCVDTSIYSPGHMIFTAPPRIEGPDFPFAKIRRFEVVEGERNELPLPSPPTGYATWQEYSRIKGKSASLPRKHAPQLNGRPVGGNSNARRKWQDIVADYNGANKTHETVRDTVFAVCRDTPGHSLKEVLLIARHELQAAIMQKAENEDAAFRRIEDHLSDPEWERSVQGAMERLGRFRDRIRLEPPVDLPPANEERKRIRDLICDFVAWVAKNGWRRQGPNSQQRHVLVISDPGAGKTTSLLSALSRNCVETLRTALLFPIRKLSQEAFARHTAVLEGELIAGGTSEDAFKSWLNDHVGRHESWQHVCTNDLLKPVKQLVESSGVNSRSICDHCKKKDRCAAVYPWRPLSGSDAIIEPDAWATPPWQANFWQHAHGATSHQTMPDTGAFTPDLTVYDEDCVSAFLSDPMPRRLVYQLKPPDPFDRIRMEGPSPTSEGISREEAHKLTLLLFGDVTLVAKALEVTGTLPMARLAAFLELERTGNLRINGAIERINILIQQLKLKLKFVGERLALEAIAADKADDDSSDPVDVHTLKEAIVRAVYIRNIFHVIALNIVCRRDHCLGLKSFELDGKRYVECHRLPRLPQYMANGSVLFFDATARESVYEGLLSSLGKNRPPLEIERARIKPGPYRLVQVTSAPFGRSRFINAAGKNSTADIRLLIAFILAIAAWFASQKLKHCCVGSDGKRKDVVVVVQKSVRVLLEKLMGELPGNVAFENFNALRGVDAYKDAPCLICVGRPAMTMRDLEMMTAALHCANPNVQTITPAPEGQWPMREQYLRCSDGTGVAVQCEYHPDPYVEDFRASRTDGEVIQTIGRLRLADRTEENAPLIFVFGRTPTGLEIDSVKTWVDCYLQPADVMVAGGLIFKSSDTIKLAYPGLLATGSSAAKEAAAKAWQHRHAAISRSSYREYIYYRKTGQLKRPRCASANPNDEENAGLDKAWQDCTFRLATPTKDGRNPKKQHATIDRSRFPDGKAARLAIEQQTGKRVTDLNWVFDC